ncbi:hypothetical protein DIPPA_70084 [Diplonema papillatum]|nr:hypothetical protein DIPPA_70084 [Diplonema papillatum]
MEWEAYALNLCLVTHSRRATRNPPEEKPGTGIFLTSTQPGEHNQESKLSVETSWLFMP